METLLQDLGYALRTLRKSPGFSFVAILTLALGVGATSALFSVAYGVLLRPLPYPEPDRIVTVHTLQGTEEGADRNLSPPNFASLVEETRTFEAVSAVLPGDHTMTGVGEPRVVESARVSAAFFSVMGVQPALGRPFLPEENQPGNERVAVIGDPLWRSAFGGDPGVIGREVVLDGVPNTIVGVMPPGFAFPPGREVWVPVAYGPRFSAATEDGRKMNTWIPVVARLRPGAELGHATRELASIGAGLEGAFPGSNAGVSFTARPLHATLVGEVRTPLLLLFGAVALLLLVACANVVGLLLARAAGRREELAVRAALGARRGRLVAQLLTEAIVLGLAGGALGLLVAVWGTEALVAGVPGGIPRLESVGVDGVVLAFTLALTLGVSLVAGVLPALRASEAALSGTLRAGGRGSVGDQGNRLRGWLVIGQMATAIVLLVGAGLLLRSFAELVSTDPGFRTERVLAFRLELPAASHPPGAPVHTTFATLLERLASSPGVEEAGAVSRLPIAQGSFGSRFSVEGREEPDGEEPIIGVLSVTPGYFAALDVPLLRGRTLGAEDRAGALPVVVINQAAARRFFPGEDPIGKRLVRFSYDAIEEVSESFTVVGVVADMRGQALTEEPEPEAFFPHAQVPLRTMSVVVRASGDPLSLAATVRREIRALDPSLPLPELRTMEGVLGESVTRPRFLATLLTLFAVVALALAAVGTFGLLSFMVAARTREIGVRLALGARPREVVGMVLRRIGALAAAGIATGIVGSLALTRLLQGQLYGVRASDPATYAAVIALLTVTALLAGLVPARRAAAVDPMTALRQD